MGQNLDIEKIKAIVAEEISEIVDGFEVSIEDIQVDIEGAKVQVTFGLHTVPEDDYIGLSIY